MTKVYLGNDKYEVSFEDSTVAILSISEIKELSDMFASDDDISKEDLIKNVEYSWKQVEQLHEGLEVETVNITDQMQVLNDLLYTRKTAKVKTTIEATIKSIYNSLESIDKHNGNYYTEIESLNASC